MAAEAIPPAGDVVVRDGDHYAENEERNGHDAVASEEDDSDGEREEEEEEDDTEEGDDDDDDDDDATASDSSSNYSSASEDSLSPIYAYGHVYHGSGRMVTPNDSCENRRQGHQHELFTLLLAGAQTFTKLPLEKLSPEGPRFHILDVGCGGGHWAMEMAQNNPLADVLGIELSGVNLPKEVPPNLTFEIADAAEDWPPRLYDFIHMRNLIGGGIRDWKRLIVQAFKHLKPGGQLEFTEFTPLRFSVNSDGLAGDTGSGGPSVEYCTIFNEIATAQGIDWDPTPKVRPWLMELGAESVRERSDWLPVLNYAKDPLTKKKGDIRHKMLDTSESMSQWAG